MYAPGVCLLGRLQYVQRSKCVARVSESEMEGFGRMRPINGPRSERVRLPLKSYALGVFVALASILVPISGVSAYPAARPGVHSAGGHIVPAAARKKNAVSSKKQTRSQVSSKSRRSTTMARARSPRPGGAGADVAPTTIQPRGPSLTPLTRAEILAGNAERLARLGRHLIIGYHGASHVRALIEKRAIAGIFITDHNVRGRSVEAVVAEIAAFQALRKKIGDPPLIVAADQEGGSVARLSPPLKRQPSLARVLANANDEREMEARVAAYAEEQARDLKRLGVTLNFAPVVDLKQDPRRRSDGETRLRLRALSNDPDFVAKVAGWYCDGLARHGILCTLKHFPGLGPVAVDTHLTPGHISTPSEELRSRDWRPFEAVMHRPNAITMLAHVRLDDVDQDHPASYSHAMVNEVVRSKLKYSGVLITDDFSMGAVTGSKEGVGSAAVKALQAGVDLILVSFSEKHLNAVMTALIAADRAGDFDAGVRAASVRRLDGVVGFALREAELRKR